jgi:hypothetical protein
MTSPPDVQNVPDVWTVLKRARDYLENNSGPGSWANEIIREADAALVQRDRFVLVPARVGTLLLEATSEGFEGAGWTDESWADWWVEMREAWHVLAASPKPKGKP